jgi:autophagy-related protein 2
VLTFLHQAFESVIPSERTRIALNITEGSVAIHATKYPGKLIIHTGETSFSTEIIGEASESTFSLSIPDLSILLIDDIQTRSDIKEGVNMKAVEAQGVDLWKVGLIVHGILYN